MTGLDVDRPAAPLSDGVVALRAWREEDVPAVVALCDDPEVARFTRVPSPYTERDAREFLDGGVIEEMSFAVVAAEDHDDVLGSIGLRDAGEGRGELGYLVAAHARGRGVASRAVRLLAEWARARRPISSRRADPGCSRRATREAARSSGSPRPWERARWPYGWSTTTSAA